MADISLYITPLIVGSIAGCTLTTSAFQRPRNVIKVIEDKHAQIDKIIGEITKNQSFNETGKVKLVEQAMYETGVSTLPLGNIFLLPMPFISIFLIDFLEFTVILLFLLAELIVLATFFLFNDTDMLQRCLLYGYLSFFSAVALMAFTHILTTVCAIAESRRLRKVEMETKDIVRRERHASFEKLRAEIEIKNTPEKK